MWTMPGVLIRSMGTMRTRRRRGAIGGWRFGNTINGAQAEYLRSNAQANLAKIPDGLSDEQVCCWLISPRQVSAEPRQEIFGSAIPLLFLRKARSDYALQQVRSSWVRRLLSALRAIIRMQMAKRMGADLVLDPNNLTLYRD